MTQIESLNRRNLVLGLVAVLLLVYLVFRPSDTSAVSSESLPALFPDLKVEEVRTVILERAGKDGEDEQETALRIQRAGEAGWVLPEAHGYPASTEKVSRFLEDLQSSRRKKFITERAETFAEYAGPEGWTHVKILGEGGRTLADFHLGKTAGWPDSFARVEEDGKSVVVRAYNLSASDVRLGAESWTEARLWAGLTLPEIERIVVYERGREAKLIFDRVERPVERTEGEPAEGEPATQKVWMMVAPEAAEPEPFKVESLVRSFTGMRFAKVAAEVPAEGGADDERFGFADHAYRIAVFGKSPKGVLRRQGVLLVGHEVPAEGEGASSDHFYVRREDDPWVFEVTAASIADFRQAPEDYLPAPEEPEEPAAPGDTTGSPDDGDDPDAPPPPGDLPPLPPDEPETPDVPDDG